MDKKVLPEALTQLPQRSPGLLHKEHQTHLRQVVPIKHHAAELVQISRLLAAEFCLQFHDRGCH